MDIYQTEKSRCIGPIEAKVPRVRDREGTGEEKIRFESNIVPKYLRRSGDMNELLPLLYLKGLSTGEFVEALTPIVGSEAKRLWPWFYKLIQSAEKRWRKLNGFKLAAEVIDGVNFKDGVKVDKIDQSVENDHVQLSAG